MRSNYNRESTVFLSVRVRGAAVSSEIRKDGKERRNIDSFGISGELELKVLSPTKVSSR